MGCGWRPPAASVFAAIGVMLVLTAVLSLGIEWTPFSVDTDRDDAILLQNTSGISLAVRGNSSKWLPLPGVPPNWTAIPTVQQVAQCIAHTHPVFHGDNCKEWDCDPLLDPGFPFPCCVQPLTTSQIFRLLNGSQVYFIGDSTARRAGYQLTSMLRRQAFADKPAHNSVYSDVIDPVTRATVSVVSHWLPFIGYLKSELQAAVAAGTAPSRLFDEVDMDRRKVIVLHYSTHDMLFGCWVKRSMGGDPAAFISICDTEMDSVASLISRSVGMFKQVRGFDPARDVLLVRLPIAEACRRQGGMDLCANFTSGYDGLNAHLARLHDKIAAALQASHPDVPCLDLMSWTRAAKGVGRAICAPADDVGVHFSSDTARGAYVQQVLHAVALLAPLRSGWPPSATSQLNQ